MTKDKIAFNKNVIDQFSLGKMQAALAALYIFIDLNQIYWAKWLIYKQNFEKLRIFSTFEPDFFTRK